MEDELSLTKLLSTSCSLNEDAADDDKSIVTCNSSSSSVVASNIDILIQILVRLPVKSLLFSKLVSKRWYSVISDSYFIHKHVARSCSNPVPGLFLLSPSSENQLLVLDESNINVQHVKTRLLDFVSNVSVDNPNGTQILQSCNGLLLCSTDKTHYIYNPTTGHKKILTRPPRSAVETYNPTDGNDNIIARLPSLGYHVLSLAFDPTKSSDYKLIYVFNSLINLCSCTIKIYSSKTNSWRIGEHTVQYNRAISSSGVFWNGSLHWMSPGYWLTYFDIDRELLKTVRMPPPSTNGKSEGIKYFGECKGHLYLINNPNRISSTEFGIFEMETDYSGWSTRYRLNLDDLPIESFEDFKVLLVEENEEDFSCKLVLQTGNQYYISYDLKDRSYKLIPSIRPALDQYKVHAYQWIDSLASV